MLKRVEFAVGDRVQFAHGGVQITGRVTRKSVLRAWVTTQRGETFKIRWKRLKRCSERLPVRNSIDVASLRAKFAPSDRVRFRTKSGLLLGVVERLGPKRALVTAADGSQYRVSYPIMELVAGEGQASQADGSSSVRKYQDPSSEFTSGDPVQFMHRGQPVTGHIARKTPRHASVTTANGREFKVPWTRIKRDEYGQPERVTARSEKLKAAFRPEDRVKFPAKSGTLNGTVARLGPKKAFVVTDNGAEYRVPYSMLEPLAVVNDRDDEAKLIEVRSEAERLMAEHGLLKWSFQYDDASRRAGCCHYRTQVISLAQQFAITAPPEEVRNTILHEIAHALVGSMHNHDSVWKAKARSIGCTGDRCHDIKFAPPRYIMSCPRCRWHQHADLRQRGVVCKTCRGPLRYQTYTKQAWDAVTIQASVAN